MDLALLGLNPKKIAQFNKRGIFSIEDLVSFLPSKYLDLTLPKTVDQIQDGDTALIVIRVRDVVPRITTVQVYGPDSNGDEIMITWFNVTYVADVIKPGQLLAAVGKLSVSYRFGRKHVEMTNPARFSDDPSKLQRILPVYRKIPGMSSDYLEMAMRSALAVVQTGDYLDENTMNSEKLISRNTMLRYFHEPANVNEIQLAKKREVFDDLFLYNIMLYEKELRKNPGSPITFGRGTTAAKYLKTLPFELTDDQKKVIRNLLTTGRRGNRVSSLLIGDVGYGKTEVAKCFALFGVEVGAQAVLMAPTVVLASQHYEDFSNSFEPLGIHVVFLASSLKSSQRKKALKEIASGKAQVIIGTQSCLSKEVSFHNLGCVIVDEEHRFGVKQRERLTEITSTGVHSLSMSATPIPRSLAFAVFGTGIDIQELRHGPAFKKPILTSVTSDKKVIFEKTLEELRKGHQAYVICPAIDTDSDVEDVTGTLEEFSRFLEPYGYTAGMLTGKMKAKELEETIQKFARNELQVLVSTTVVEVGVNIPNATLMVIENADRFGLAQLHQLRGRVGRGKDQGYCLLNNQNPNAKERIDFLASTNDGFAIAQKDLELRGTGSFAGTEQHGDSKYVDEMIRFPKYNEHIRELVKQLYARDEIREYYRSTFSETLEEYGLNEQN